MNDVFQIADYDKIIIEKSDGEILAVLENDVDNPIIVKDGVQVRLKPISKELKEEIYK